MQIHDISDYYRPKRFPWLPVSLIGIVAIIALVHIFSKNVQTQRENDPDAVEALTTGTPDKPGTDPSLGTQPANVPLPLPPAAEPADPLPKAQVDAKLAECRKLEANGELERARELYLSILDRTGGNIRTQIEHAIGRLSIDLFTTPRPMKGKVEYIIQAGDSLSKIAAKHNCPILLIQKANSIADPARIRIGTRLILPNQPKFSLLVSKSENTLAILLNGQLFKKYSVGTGIHSKTPVGTFRISDKIANPPWWPGDGRAVIPYGAKENILGTHWLALEATGETPRLSGYGIHGTWEESSIGRQSSAGCVRMRNADVGELFMLLPRDTPVRIME